MNSIIAYLLKVILCSAIFFGYYLLALRNKNFHPFNRFYLLATALISVLLPLLHISMFDISSNNQNILALMQLWGSGSLPDVVVSTQKSIPWESIAIGLSLVFTFLLIVIQLISIRKVYAIRSKFPKQYIDKVTFINTDIQQAPFSFLTNLFWRRDISLDDALGEQIYRHEMAHITQKHSWDKIFFKTLKAFFWMNPLFYVMEKELLLIHEFIADEKAIQDKDVASLAQMLLRTQIGQFNFEPAHAFFYSSIKKRLHMITNSQKPKYSYLRRLMFLPLFFVVTFIFAFRAHAREMAQQQKELTTLLAMNSKAPVAASSTAQKQIISLGLKPDTTVQPKITVVKGDKDGVSIKSSDAQPLYVLDGKVVASEDMNTIIDPDQIEAISVLKGTSGTKLYGDKGKNGVVLITSKAAKSKTVTKELTGHVNGLTTDKLTQNVKFTNNVNEALVFIDGKESSQEALKKVSPDQIVTMNVYKDDRAIYKYGDKAKGGVIDVRTKKDKTPLTQNTFTPDNQKEPSFPGGQLAWRSFLEKNLKVQTPVNNGAGPGTYEIVVSFLVSKTGEVSEVMAASKPEKDYGCAAEAVRLIKVSGKWNPATIDGKPATFREKQKIIFQVSK